MHVDAGPTGMNQNASCFYGCLYFFPAERSPHDLLATSSFATKVVAMSLRIASFCLLLGCQFFLGGLERVHQRSEVVMTLVMDVVASMKMYCVSGFL